MALDSDIVRLDLLGIFPHVDETPDAFVDRGEQVLTKSAEVIATGELIITHGERELEVKGLTPIEPIKDIRSFQLGFDSSWMPFFAANLTRDPIIDPQYGGLAYPSIVWNGEDGKRFNAPFAIINYDQSQGGMRRSARHEMLHVPRLLAFVDPPITFDCSYPERESYEEMIAEDSLVTSLTRLGRKERTTLRQDAKALIQYNFARWHLHRAFGADSGYVLYRTPQEEVREWYKEEKRNPREIIGMRAELGDLRYQIIKERLKI